MTKLPISVIIPVSNDNRIKNCLESIDNGEIVVVLNNATPEVIRIVKNDNRIKIIYANNYGANLAKILNAGILAVKNNKVIITNSDCIFPRGFIEDAEKLLNKYDVVKARVTFLHNNFPQYLVAQVRFLFHHIFNSGQNIFGPGMAFNKTIISSIGGYYFDENLGWAEDGDLSRRIHNAGISCYFVDKVIEHSSENMIHDLNSATRIGRGIRAIHKKRGVGTYKGLMSLLLDLICDRKNQVKLSYKNGGLLVTGYFLVWNIFLMCGYLFRRNN